MGCGLSKPAAATDPWQRLAMLEEAKRASATAAASLPISSPLPKLTAADHKGCPLLAALDKQLVAALRSGAIKLLRAEFLRADSSEAMLPAGKSWSEWRRSDAFKSSSHRRRLLRRCAR